MKAIIFILLKYWKKHLKSAFALIFSGALLTAIVFTMLMSAREECVRYYHNVFDQEGHFDIIIANSNDELLSRVTESKKTYDYGVINVFGEMGYRENWFTYGTISDEHDLWHVPLDEGRMPETENEIAAVGSVLDAFYWVGKCGGTITLDGKEYTVTGIINSDYGTLRPVCNPFLPPELQPIVEISNSPYRIPLIFVGKSDEAPLYRIDLIGGFFAPDITDNEFEESVNYLYELVGYEDRWFDCKCDSNILYARIHTQPTKFLMIITWIGAAISALSVYSVLRMIFIERRGRIEILKRIGMPKRGIYKMYALECAGFAVIQTLVGLLAGLAAYGGIWLFKTGALGEKPYSAFTDLAIVYEKTSDPVFFACVVSIVVAVAAYLINVLTAKTKTKAPGKNTKPRSLYRCFTAAFRQSKITAVQLISLTLICFSAIMGYMFYTDNGKEITAPLAYVPSKVSYYANGFDMEKNNIAEYYFSATPTVNILGHMNNKPIHSFPFIMDDFSGGFNDELVARLPEGSFITGNLEQTFIASDDAYVYFDEIDLSNEVVRETFLEFSDKEFGNFFDEGELGSKKMYRIFTKLAPSSAINRLSENVTAGSIDFNALNRGEEILLVYNSQKPPFEVGESIMIYSAAAMENGYGISELTAAKVKIAALIRIPDDMGEIERYTVLGEEECNFLTTAKGAQAMGFPGTAYTELYSPKEIDGSIFPSSARMQFQSLSQMKRSNVIDLIARYSGVTLILLLMSLLGFSGYFNGIGLKINQKKYEISIFRAVGTPMLNIRKRMFLESIKIPAAASVLSYGMVKFTQLIMKLAYMRVISLHENMSSEEERNMISSLIKKFFLDNVMWQVNAEIPSLILFVVLCIVTFILTAAALQKFKGNIADDMNIGRTRE